MIRQLIATRPLLAHMLVGGGVGATFTLQSYYERRNEILRDIEEARKAADAVKLREYTKELELERKELPVELATAAFVGTFSGAAMRYWYPLIESAASSTALRIAIDAAPALLATAGVHYAARAWYASEYSLPADPDSLQYAAQEVIDKIQESFEAAQRAGRELIAGQAVSDDGSGAAGPSMADSEQVELIDLILQTQPSIANAVTFAITVANFTLVPRWLRGVVGIVQWHLYDAIDDAKHADASPVRVSAHVSVEEDQDGYGITVHEELRAAHGPAGGHLHHGHERLSHEQLQSELTEEEAAAAAAEGAEPWADPYAPGAAGKREGKQPGDRMR